MEPLKVLIMDLDNTIYPVSSIGDKLFAPLFELFEKNGIDKEVMPLLKAEVMRRPFQYIANDFKLSDELKAASDDLLSNLRYPEPMTFFKGYEVIRNFKLKKYLVTTGYTVMQESKVEQLQIGGDFDEIIIIDPRKDSFGKYEVFQRIQQQEGLDANEILVVGDDPQSELLAAKRLGIPTVIYGPQNSFPNEKTNYRARNYNELAEIIAALI